ncbi:YesU [Pleurostoma richardsiae]|uniref:YesU n=1 Tax=Pleurostoma richardsiae TaxID=41990 RepID=A0AA38RJ10_9PEZI|nr:YesU [Pleurostoma richardsiae]
MAEKLVYSNPLDSASAVADWVAEGPVQASTAADGALELSSSGGDNGHFTFWCPEVFGDRVRVTWEFSPAAEPGLAMLFFGAASATGGGIFDEGLAPRTGAYPQYHSGDVRTLHVSYFRRRWEDERAFHTCNLRKSPGFHLVAQGADPLPPVADARGAFYRVEVVKDGPRVRFAVNDLPLFSWTDDGASTGPVVGGGRIGFRQMAPLVARYRNLKVWELP